MNSYDNSY